VGPKKRLNAPKNPFYVKNVFLNSAEGTEPPPQTPPYSGEILKKTFFSHKMVYFGALIRFLGPTESVRGI